MSLSAVIIRRKCLRCQNINPQSSIRPKLMFVLLQQMFKVSTICFYASFHRLQKSTTDLQIVRSGKLSQILCNTHFRSDAFWGFEFINNITVLLVLDFDKCIKNRKKQGRRFCYFYADQQKFLNKISAFNAHNAYK